MNKKSDILIYQSHDGNIKIDVRLQEETVWLTQAQMGQLFGKDKRTISEHIRNIFNEGELDKNMVVRKFRTTTQHGAIPGKTQEHEVKGYNLDVIISVGYRVKSHQGTQFRIWATQRLKEYIIKGFTLNDERTIAFFKKVQNKLLWAISQQTAAELVYRRVDASLPFMGMQSFDKKDLEQIKKSDVSIAKNYLTEQEMRLLGLLVEQYLAFAETMAEQQTPMYMDDWIERLDVILKMNGRELLDHAGKISHQMALEKSSEEYETFKEQRKKLKREESLKEIEEDIKKLKKK
ncbi:MAG TPA: RhuM family protein [Bacteroidales bacterium]|nr:RhuM family protein [Bacteroidales bacterium]